MLSPHVESGPGHAREGSPTQDDGSAARFTQIFLRQAGPPDRGGRPLRGAWGRSHAEGRSGGKRRLGVGRAGQEFVQPVIHTQDLAALAASVLLRLPLRPGEQIAAKSLRYFARWSSAEARK